MLQLHVYKRKTPETWILCFTYLLHPRQKHSGLLTYLHKGTEMQGSVLLALMSNLGFSVFDTLTGAAGYLTTNPAINKHPTTSTAV